MSVYAKITSAEVINSMQRDFLKITLIQEAKLKHHLLNEMKRLTEQPGIDILKQWAADLDRNFNETQELLKKVLNMLKIFQSNLEAARKDYSKLNELTINKDKEKIAELQIKRTQQLEMISIQERKRSNYRIAVANVIIWSVPIALILVFAIPAIILMSPLIGIAAGCIAIKLLLAGLVYKEMLVSLYQRLLQKINFSFLVNDMYKSLEETENQMNILQKEVNLWNVDHKFGRHLRDVCDHAVLIDSLESDLREIELCKVQSGSSSYVIETTTTSALTTFGLFNNPEDSASPAREGYEPLILT